jgi:plasmid stability protein
MECMKLLTINLPDDLEQRLQEVSQREHRSPEETVCEILRRRLLSDRFHELCRESEQLAKAAGFESEDDVLRAIS